MGLTPSATRPTPLITLLGFEFSALLSGAAFTEIITSWPGMGLVALEAVRAKDMFLVMATVLMGSFLLLAGNLLADILHAWNDPRVKLSVSALPLSASRPALKAVFGASRLSRAAILVLGILYLSAIFAMWLAPYGPDDESRTHSWAPPSRIHWVLPDGGFRPYVHPVSFTFDEDARRVYVEDSTRIVPVRLFVNGCLFGLDSLEAASPEADGTPARFYLLGADARGRDLLSRLLYGGRVSLSIGIVGVVASPRSSR